TIEEADEYDSSQLSSTAMLRAACMPFPSCILLVEDDEQIANLLKIWLERDWPPTTRIVYAATLADATQGNLAYQVDMFLVDLALPDSTGLEVIDALIGLMPHDRPVLPMVIVTGAIKAGIDALQALRHGAGDWVTKGDPLTLRVRLKEAMEREW